MRSWKRRIIRRRPYLRPPARVGPERLEEARRAAMDAEATLNLTLERMADVDERAATAERIHRENNLGPRFWAAMESLTRGHA